jgi:hypothetical protein
VGGTLLFSEAPTWYCKAWMTPEETRMLIIGNAWVLLLFVG